MDTQIWGDTSFVMLYFLIVCYLLSLLIKKGGSFAEAAVVRAGYSFNHPLHIGHVATSAAASKVKDIMTSIQFSGSPNVVLDTVKRGEDDDDVTSTPIKKRDFRNVILRIYEAYGGKGKAKVSTYISKLYPP
jgi:alpha-mannosidase